MYQEILNGMSEDEKSLFVERVLAAGEEWYQYMHGQRSEPDDPVTIMKRDLELFDGDWMGLIDFDMSMGVWSAKYFYNKVTGSSSKTLIEEAECAEQAERWRTAVNNNLPIVIEDIEDIRLEAPAEYKMYKRLQVQSVLAVPYRNCGSGLLVVRNPKQFKDNYIVLNIMSYIITSELNALLKRQSISRKTVDYEPASYDEIQIRLFGDMEIVGKELYLNASDIPEPIRFMIAYLASNPGRAVSAEQINDLYGGKIASWKNLIYKFRNKWKSARVIYEDENQLIVTSERGYTLNQNLRIIVDIDQVTDLMKAIEDASDVRARIELFRKFMATYRGEFMQNENHDNRFYMEYRNLYNANFVARMDEFLELLYSQHEYSMLTKYSTDIIKIYPGSVNVYAWRIAAFKKQGQMDLAKITIASAKELFEDDELKMLKEKVASIDMKMLFHAVS